jgi:hypothetical protein
MGYSSSYTEGLLDNFSGRSPLLLLLVFFFKIAILFFQLLGNLSARAQQLLDS